jgi:hypothetical protein
MITEIQLTEAGARLDDGKITPSDISKLASAFEMFFAGLTAKYGYDYVGKLGELDDTTDVAKTASQVVAALIVMEQEGFGVSGFSGSGSGMFYKEEDEYLKYVLFAFSKIYPIPLEFSKFNVSRWFLDSMRVSSTVLTERVP